MVGTSLGAASALAGARTAAAQAPSTLETTTASRPRKAGPILVRSRRQLLCDQVLVERGSALLKDWPRDIRWNVGSVERSPEPVYVPHLPWEQGCFYWPRVLYDGGRFRLWYNAAADETIGGITQEYDNVAYAESDDGIHWRTPELGIIEWNGSKKNNIVFNAGRSEGGLRAHGPAPFIDPAAPPAERYKMVYGDNLGSRTTNGSAFFGLLGAYSADGLHWRRYPEVFMIKPDAQSGVSYDPVLGKYVAYVRGGGKYGGLPLGPDPIPAADRGRTIFRMESDDFRKWTPPVPCLEPDIYDPMDMDYYTNGYSAYPWADRVHFMFPGAFHAGPQKTRIQVAVSRDNVHWTRPARETFIDNGPEGSYDAGMIYVAPGLVDVGGDRLALYTQTAALGKDSMARQKSPYHGFAMGRVTFRKDRIIGMEAGQAEGFFSTRDLLFEGGQLEVNAEPTAANGQLSVEIASVESGRICDGYEFSACDTIRRDDLHTVVRWGGKTDVSRWAQKPVRVRFRARSMRIYAFQFKA